MSLALRIASCCHSGKSSRGASCSAARNSSLVTETTSPVVRLRKEDCSSDWKSIPSRISWSLTCTVIPPAPSYVVSLLGGVSACSVSLFAAHVRSHLTQKGGYRARLACLVIGCL